MIKVIFLLVFFTFKTTSLFGEIRNAPEFVDIKTIIPDIAVDIRYATSHNFVGEVIDGYKAEKCIISRLAALNLKKVQEELKKFSLSLKMYDCYRPEKAVKHFVNWSKDSIDNKMKKEFYPLIDKKLLFKKGFISEKSGHCRGSTVDLTIVGLPLSAKAVFDDKIQLKECDNPVSERFPDNSLDMGTGYDCFSELSATLSAEISASARANRLLLKTLMESNNFLNYDKEWWHFTLKNEPYAGRSFDFDVE